MDVNRWWTDQQQPFKQEPENVRWIEDHVRSRVQRSGAGAGRESRRRRRTKSARGVGVALVYWLCGAWVEENSVVLLLWRKTVTKIPNRSAQSVQFFKMKLILLVIWNVWLSKGVGEVIQLSWWIALLRSVERTMSLIELLRVKLDVSGYVIANGPMFTIVYDHRHHRNGFVFVDCARRTLCNGSAACMGLIGPMRVNFHFAEMKKMNL